MSVISRSRWRPAGSACSTHVTPSRLVGPSDRIWPRHQHLSAILIRHATTNSGERRGTLHLLSSTTDR